MALSFKPKPTYKKNVNTQQGLFNQILITKTIPININNIGNNIKETLEKAIAFQIEGKCIVEGYVKLHSVRVITYSSGTIKGTDVIFDVVFECDVCFPVAGMLFNCVAKNITKAGIRAESVDDLPSPFVLFIARDHYYDSDYFNSIEENEKFTAKVIAQRFELNDKYVSIIAELVPQSKEGKKEFKPRLVLDGV